MKILILNGSNREGSFNRTLEAAATASLPEGAETVTFGRLADMPHYEERYDETGEIPAAAAELREAVAAADALLVITPEYNGGMPSLLKGGIDWASRPYGESSITGKPAAVIGASPSSGGSARARAAAVVALEVAGAEPLEQTVGVAAAYEAFDGERLLDQKLAGELRELLRELGGRVPAVA